jgi:hypothetical protein
MGDPATLRRAAATLLGAYCERENAKSNADEYSVKYLLHNNYDYNKILIAIISGTAKIVRIIKE